MPSKKKIAKNKKLITKAEFARICQVKAPNLTPMYKKSLKEIIVDGRVDLNHPKAIKYLKRRGINPTKVKREKTRGVGRGSIEKRKVNLKNEPPDKPKKKGKFKPKKNSDLEDLLNDLPDDIRKYAHMPLIELIEIFGTDVRFSDWLQNVKRVEDIAEKQLKNETTRGELIPREFVRTRIFDLIETSNTRLLNDSPRTIVARINELIESSEPREMQETVVREIISTQIKAIKVKAKRSLINASKT